MKTTIAPANNVSNNRNQHLIGFKDISLQWFEKLKKILDEDNKKENEAEIIHKFPITNSMLFSSPISIALFYYYYLTTIVLNIS